MFNDESETENKNKIIKTKEKLYCCKTRTKRNYTAVKQDQSEIILLYNKNKEKLY